MKIQRKILKKIGQDPDMFAEVLILMNRGLKDKIKPNTLLQRLQRRSENIESHVVIVDFLKSKGYTDEQIFEQEKK